MAFWDFRRGVAGVQVLLDYGVQAGMDPTLLLKGTGLSLMALQDAQGEILAAQELRLITNLIEDAGNPDGLGWSVGQRYHLSSYGLWGYGLISSADVRSAIALALRFVRLTYAFTLITFRESAQGGLLQFGEPDLPGDLLRFLVQRDVSASVTLLSELIGGDLNGAAIQLRAALAPDFSLPSDWPIVAPPKGVNAIAVPAHILSIKLKQANPITVAMCESLCADLMRKRLSTKSTADRVQAHLRIPGMQVPDLLTMAELLHLSPRTLRRRLAEEGTSFRDLCATARMSWAEELLADPRISITAVADRLGFSDLSSFSQAFTRWKGCSPRQYRGQVN